MAAHTVPTTRRPAWRPIAAAIVGAAILVATGFGVWATLSATAANATPESISTGTLKLTMTDNGAGFSQSISNVAPGDVVNRYVALSNAGTLEGQALTMQVAASGSSALISDGSSTRALRVSVTGCSVAWNPSTGSCGGSTTQLLAPTVLASLSSAATLVQGAVQAGAAQYLQISVQLPDQNETTVNGTLPTTTIQNQSAQLTYTFAETQRNATTNNS